MDTDDLLGIAKKINKKVICTPRIVGLIPTELRNKIDNRAGCRDYFVLPNNNIKFADLPLQEN